MTPVYLGVLYQYMIYFQFKVLPYLLNIMAVYLKELNKYSKKVFYSLNSVAILGKFDKRNIMQQNLLKISLFVSK